MCSDYCEFHITEYSNNSPSQASVLYCRSYSTFQKICFCQMKRDVSLNFELNEWYGCTATLIIDILKNPRENLSPQFYKTSNFGN